MRSIPEIKSEDEKRAEHVARRMQKADPDLYAALCLVNRLDNVVTDAMYHLPPSVTAEHGYERTRDEVRRDVAEITERLKERAKQSS